MAMVNSEDRVAETMRRFAPPTFASVDDERRHRKIRAAVGFRVLARRNLVTGINGHISVRDPEFPERFWVNPLGRPFSKMCASDLLLVDHNGEILAGDNLMNAAAFAIHSRIHAANPSVVSACHSHGPWGRAWSACRRLVEPTSQDACAFYGSQALIGGFSGAVLGLDVGDLIGKAFATRGVHNESVKVGVHENHGHITVGATVDEAVFWFVLFEQLCEAQMRLEATGRAYSVLDDEVARHTAEQVGTAYAGWIGFQGMCAEIIADEPDVMD